MLDPGFFYSYGGIGIRSELPLNCLARIPASSADEPDIAISLASLSSEEMTYLDHLESIPATNESQMYCLGKLDGVMLVRYPGLVDIRIATDASSVTLRVHGGASPAQLTAVVLNQILPGVLDLQGYLALHCAAIQLDDFAILVFGHSGAGKSTLSASFHSAGFRVLSDDCAIITQLDRTPEVTPTYPSLRLWPDSLAGVYDGLLQGAPKPAAQFKQEVPMRPQDSTDTLPLRAAFWLSLSEASPGTGKCQQLAPARACKVVYDSAFLLSSASNYVRQRLASASKLAATAPVYELLVPRGYGFLEQTRNLIFETAASFDFHSHSAKQGAGS